MSTRILPSSSISVLPGPSVSTVVPSSTGPPVFGISTLSPGLPLSSFQSGFSAGASGFSTSTTTRSISLPSLSLTTTTILSPGLASSSMSTTRLPSSSISALPGPSVSTVVPSSTGPPVFGISTLSPGLPLSSFQSGFSAGASGSSTVTVTSTVSFEPSGYVTSTGTVILSPGLASSGTGTVISPVFSSTFTPSGAPSPGVNFVPSGASVGLPSLSLKPGASIVTSSPGLPEPSS